MASNPFTPTFGSSPPLLVGRQDLIDDFGDGLDNGPGSPERAVLFAGVRGIGKTVMLNAVEDAARERGWVVISETALPGMLHRIIAEHLPALLSQIDPKTRRRRLNSVSATTPVGGLGVGWENQDSHEVAAGLRSQIHQVTDLLAKNGTGLLITVDEVHRGEVEAMRLLGAEIQHAFREERDVAFAGAGLPSAVSDLLGAEGATFLRRAERHSLGAVEDLDELSSAIRIPIEDRGRRIGAEALTIATDATDGYPFLIQLVGYHVWRQHPARVLITRGDVEAGIAAATRRLGALVHEPSLATVSDVGKTYLVAMAVDEGPSRTGVIADRIGVGANYASVYRQRLLEAELIRPAGYGRVDFTLPYLRQYLREHATSLVPPGGKGASARRTAARKAKRRA